MDFFAGSDARQDTQNHAHMSAPQPHSPLLRLAEWLLLLGWPTLAFVSFFPAWQSADPFARVGLIGGCVLLLGMHLWLVIERARQRRAYNHLKASLHTQQVAQEQQRQWQEAISQWVLNFQKEGSSAHSLSALNEMAARLLNASAAGAWVFIRPANGQEPVLLSSDHYEQGAALHLKDYVFAPEKYGEWLERLSQGEHIISHQPLEDPRLQPIKEKLATRQLSSIMLLPLEREGNVMGTYWIERNNAQPWSQDEELLANQIAALALLTLGQAKTEAELKELSVVATRFEALSQVPGTGTACFELLMPVKPDAPEAEEQLCDATNLTFANPTFAHIMELPNGTDYLHGQRNTRMSFAELLGNQAALPLIRHLLDSPTWEVENFLLSKEVAGAEETPFPTRYVLVSCRGIVEQDHLQRVWLTTRDVSQIQDERVFLTTLFTHSSNGIMAIGQKNQLLYETPAAAALLGFTLGERQGVNVLSFLHPEDFEKVEQIMAQVRKEGLTKPFISLRLRKSSGTYLYTDGTVSLLKSGPTTGTILLEFRDSGLRKTTEEEQVTQVSFLEAMLAHSGETLTLTDWQGDVVYESPAMERLMGHPAASRLSRYGLEYLHPDDVAAASELFEKARKNPGQPYTRQVQFLNTRNKYVSALLTLQGVEEGAPLNGVILRLSPHPHTALPLTGTSEAAPAEKLEWLPTPALITDFNGEIRQTNAAAHVLLNLPVPSGPPPLLQDYLHKSDRQALADYLHLLRAGLAPQLNPHLRTEHPSAGERLLSIKGQLLPGRLQPGAVMLMLEDITHSAREMASLSELANFHELMAGFTKNILLLLNKEGEIQYVNSSARKLLGYQLQGNIEQWLPGNQAAAFIDELQQLANMPEKSGHGSCFLMDRNGKWLPFAYQLRSSGGEGGLTGMLVEMAPVEESMMKVLEKQPPGILFHYFFGPSSLLVAIANDKGHIISMNPVGMNLFGKETGLPELADLVAEGSQKALSQLIESLATLKDEASAELELTNQERHYWFRVWMAQVPMEHGRGYLLIGQDISQAVEKSRFLEQELFFYKQQDRCLPSAAWLAEANGNIVWHNRQAERWIAPHPTFHLNSLADLEKRLPDDKTRESFRSAVEATLAGQTVEPLTTTAQQTETTQPFTKFFFIKALLPQQEEEGLLIIGAEVDQEWSQINRLLAQIAEDHAGFAQQTAQIEQSAAQALRLLNEERDAEMAEKLKRFAEDIGAVRQQLQQTEEQLQESQNAYSTLRHQLAEVNSHALGLDRLAAQGRAGDQVAKRVRPALQYASGLMKEVRQNYQTIRVLLDKFQELTQVTALQPLMKDINEFKEQIGYAELITGLHYQLNATAEYIETALAPAKGLHQIDELLASPHATGVKETLEAALSVYSSLLPDLMVRAHLDGDLGTIQASEHLQHLTLSALHICLDVIGATGRLEVKAASPAGSELKLNLLAISHEHRYHPERFTRQEGPLHPDNLMLLAFHQLCQQLSVSVTTELHPEKGWNMRLVVPL